MFYYLSIPQVARRISTDIPSAGIWSCTHTCSVLFRVDMAAMYSSGGGGDVGVYMGMHLYVWPYCVCVCVCVCLLVCLCVQLRHPCAGMCTCTPIVNSSKWGSFYYYNGVRCSPIQIYLSLIYLLPLHTVLIVQGTSCSNKCNYITTCIFSVCVCVCVFARD